MVKQWIPGTAIPALGNRKQEKPLPPGSMDDFGKRLRAWRRQRRLNQNQLSLRSQVSRTSISHYECGYYHPHRDTLLRLAHALQVEEHFMSEIPGARWQPPARPAKLTGKTQ